MRFSRRLLLASSVMACAGSMVPSFAHASDPAPLVGRAEVNWRYGSERSILMSEFWVPFLQDGESVLYGDARLMGDDQDNNEFNLGLGYREIVDAPLLGRGVAGVHGWFDRRITARGSTFHQATLGAEWLGEEFDILANTYIPLSDEKRYTTGTSSVSDPFLSGTGIFVNRTSASEVIEEPQAGFDIEFGWQVPFAQELTDSARIYGGAYYFDGDHTENVAGWRTRLAVDVTSDIQIGGRFQRDDERGSQGFLEATIRFPFGQKKSFRDHGLYARLDDSPERDIDIVTGAQVSEGSGGGREAVKNTETGEDQVILYVDNTAGVGGDGSIENPYDTLAAAAGIADAHHIIYVKTGDGTSAGQNAGITLDKTGQQLIGAGTDFTFDSDRFSISGGSGYSGKVLLAAGTAPVITNSTPNSDAITINANDVRVAGIAVSGATRDGIVVSDALRVEFDKTTIVGNAGRGLYVDASGANNTSFSMSNSTISGNQSNGIEFADNSTGAITADLGGGSFSSTGGNHIFGNLDTEIEADLDGGAITAQNNYWGGGALTDTDGADAGNIDASGAIGTSTCSNCIISLSGSFTNQSNVIENQLITGNTITASGFTGTRFITVTGDGSPELVINGTPQGSATAQISNGDTVAVRLTSSTTGLNTQNTTLTAGESTEGFDVATRFLPNAIGNIALWLDATDIDGDFDTSDEASTSTAVAQWNDKTGSNHATQSVAASRPTTGTRTVNGLNVVDFDGTDDSMSLSSNLFTVPNGENTVILVMARDEGTSFIRPYGSNQGGRHHYFRSASNNYQFNSSSGQSTTATKGFTHDTASHVLVGVADTKNNLYIDGGTKTTGGNRSNITQFESYLSIPTTEVDGTYSEVLIYKRALNTSELNQIGNYLSSKWGTSWSDIP